MLNSIKKIFRRKQPRALERKSFGAGSIFNFSGTGASAATKSARHFPINMHLALLYYRLAAPVKLSIDRIVDEFATIPQVVEGKDSEILPDHPVLDLLKNPNVDATQNEFFQSIGSFFNITGNAYILATGNVNRPPLELFSINPVTVNVDRSSRDPFPSKFTIDTGERNSLVFRRVESSFQLGNRAANRIRFIADNDKELWQIKTFSPLMETTTLEGLSPLSALAPEIEQYLNASLHNDSLLSRGATLSGIFSLTDSEAVVDQDQQEAIRDQIRTFYSGAENAGRAFFSQQLDFKSITQNNKDMDFATLQSMVFETIVTGLKVPLPLVSGDNMTFNNIENAMLILYDNAVIPLAKRIFNELSLFLLPRYGNTEGLNITFVDSELPALEPRRNAELNKVKDLGVLTIDEIRKMLGFEPLESGGDAVYLPATLVPIGNDDFTNDQPEKPVDAVTKDLKLLDAQAPDGTSLITSDLIKDMELPYGQGDKTRTCSGE